jgi:hypothetical protein
MYQLLHVSAPMCHPLGVKLKQSLVSPTRTQLRSLVATELPKYDTLVPKHVGVGTSYEMCFMVFFVF